MLNITAVELADKVASSTWVDDFLSKVPGIVANRFRLRKRLRKKNSPLLYAHISLPTDPLGTSNANLEVTANHVIKKLKVIIYV